MVGAGGRASLVIIDWHRLIVIFILTFYHRAYRHHCVHRCPRPLSFRFATIFRVFLRFATPCFTAGVPWSLCRLARPAGGRAAILTCGRVCAVVGQLMVLLALVAPLFIGFTTIVICTYYYCYSYLYYHLLIVVAPILVLRPRLTL